MAAKEIAVKKYVVKLSADERARLDSVITTFTLHSLAPRIMAVRATAKELKLAVFGDRSHRLPDCRLTLPLAQSCPRCGARTRRRRCLSQRLWASGGFGGPAAGDRRKSAHEGREVGYILT